MKRTISMFGALAVAAGFFLFGAPAANAAAPGPGTHGGITCSVYTTGSKYPAPNYFLTCLATGSHPDVTTQVKNGRFGVLSSETQIVRDHLQALDAKFYLFWNYDDYETWYQAAGGTPIDNNSPVGMSRTGIVNPDNHSVIFMEDQYGVPRPLDIVDDAIAHEAGHHLDVMFGVSLNVFPDRASDYSRWSDLNKHDRFMLNNKWKAGNKYSKRKSCGSGGALVNLFDPTRGERIVNGVTVYGQYVCDGNKLREKNVGGYIDETGDDDPGYKQAYQSSADLFDGTNYAVLKYVDDRFNKKAETFASTFSVVAGEKANFHWGFSSQTRMIDAEFKCITALVSSLRIRDREPGNPPGSGYSTNCTRSFIGIQEEPDEE